MNRLKAYLKFLLANYTEKRFRLLILRKCSNISDSEKRYLKNQIMGGHSVIGYVPFIKNHTGYILFNFFSVNYGVRSNIDLILVVFDSLGNVQNAHKKVLFHRAIEWQHPIVDASDDLPEEGTLAILAINKSFRVNHGLHQGHLRFWGMYDESAMVHSMPIDNTCSKRLRFVERTCHSEYSKKAIFCNFKSRFIHLSPNGDVSDSLRVSGSGYNVLVCDDGNISSVHHSAGLNRKGKLKEYPTNELANPEFHSFIGIPPVPDLDVQVFFREGFELGSRISIFLEKLRSDNTIYIIDHQEMSIPASGCIRLSDLFRNLDSTFGIWARIEPISGRFDKTYANVTYINKNTSNALDSVHSHNLAPSSSHKRSLKFIPFIHENDKYSDSLVASSYLAIWGATGHGCPTKIRLRIFAAADSSLEAVHNILIPNNAVTYISSEVLIREFSKQNGVGKRNSYAQPEIGAEFVVQLESEEHNLSASSYIFTYNTNCAIKALACDHMTGG
jgi:hypothetical protein